MGTDLPSVFISTAGHRILFVFISTTENRITRAIWNVIALELRASFSARREAFTPASFSFFSLRFSFFFLMFVYQAKIIQDCFYHKPLNNSTGLLSYSPTPLL